MVVGVSDILLTEVLHENLQEIFKFGGAESMVLNYHGNVRGEVRVIAG